MILCPRCNSSRIMKNSNSKFQYKCQMCEFSFNYYESGAIKFEPIDPLTMEIFEMMEERNMKTGPSFNKRKD